MNSESDADVSVVSVVSVEEDSAVFLSDDPSFSVKYKFFAFKRTFPFSSSGLGSCSILGRPSTGAWTRLSPNVSCMILAIRSCCANEQCTSAEIMIGYGDATNAYFAIASQISRKGTLDVRVFPW